MLTPKSMPARGLVPAFGKMDKSRKLVEIVRPKALEKHLNYLFRNDFSSMKRRGQRTGGLWISSGWFADRLRKGDLSTACPDVIH